MVQNVTAIVFATGVIPYHVTRTRGSVNVKLDGQVPAVHVEKIPIVTKILTVMVSNASVMTVSSRNHPTVQV
jgi:hypothetical protein